MTRELIVLFLALVSLSAKADGLSGNLKSIYFHLQSPLTCTANPHMFKGCSEDMTIYIPMYTRNDYSNASGWEKYMSTMSMEF